MRGKQLATTMHSIITQLMLWGVTNSRGSWVVGRGSWVVGRGYKVVGGGYEVVGAKSVVPLVP